MLGLRPRTRCRVQVDPHDWQRSVSWLAPLGVPPGVALPAAASAKVAPLSKSCLARIHAAPCGWIRRLRIARARSRFD